VSDAHRTRLPVTHAAGLIPAAFTRVYATKDGHSHFEEIDLRGDTRSVDYAELVATFSEPFEADRLMFRHVVREASADDPHNAPRRQFIVMMTGVCEIETSDGEVRRFGPGSVILVEDLEGYGHITRRIGDDDRLTLLITLPHD